MSDILWQDGDLSVRTAVGNYAFEAYFRNLGNPEDCILRQKIQVLQANYEGTKPAVGDPHPDEADYGFCYDEGLTDIGGLVWEFTAVYAKVPTSFSKPGGKYPYLFPAFVTGSALTSRPATQLVVGMRIQYDFARTNDPYTDLPVVEEQRYVLAGNTDVDATDSTGQRAVSVSTVPGIAFTIPSYEDYKTDWIPNKHEIVPEAAAPEVWMGNIYVRKTFILEAH